MLFKDLLVINKNWDEMTSLVIIDRDADSPQQLKCRFARSLYGSKQVMWFKDDVVILF